MFGCCLLILLFDGRKELRKELLEHFVFGVKRVEGLAGATEVV
ncbi:hypothetical protein AU14_17425 [Marinobacter similis]|uniref:Uncharacterized protein n=1 Tax=Marinobacter similis TaxID=1420916 RepID=W5YMD2_9GAMM|nr:hypothetical protein AU14_17425 [Marinobacter similis]